MRTTLDLDDDLMRALLARYPGRSKREVVEIAIREHLHTNAYRRALELEGAFPELEDATAWTRRDRVR